MNLNDAELQRYARHIVLPQIGGVGHAVNVAFTGYYQENGNAYVANTPAQSVPSNIYHPSPLPVVTGTRLPPQKANEIMFRSMAIADTMRFVNPLFEALQVLPLSVLLKRPLAAVPA